LLIAGYWLTVSEILKITSQPAGAFRVANIILMPASASPVKLPLRRSVHRSGPWLGFLFSSETNFTAGSLSVN